MNLASLARVALPFILWQKHDSMRMRRRTWEQDSIWASENYAVSMPAFFEWSNERFGFDVVVVARADAERRDVWH